MFYLSGVVNKQLLEHPHAGLMRTPWIGNKVSGEHTWAADTGCFTRPYDDTVYFRWLDGLNRDTCLFATAPDVVGDWAATLSLATPVLPRLRGHGYKAAVVLQDGCTSVPWDEVDAVFIGGSTGWKLGWQAHELAVEAKRRGKWVHMGRVNSWRRISLAGKWGCDSVDGTYLAFGPDILRPKLEAWLNRINNEKAVLK